jgi:predicted GIY-YIG superfamily endonuclease
MQKELKITTFSEEDMEHDSELENMLDSDYYPSDDEHDFKVGSVYMISSTGTDKVYIGSTINPKGRWSCHKSKANKCMSRFIIEHGNYAFKIIAQMRYTSDLALRIIERQIMKQYVGRLINKSGTIFSKEVGDSRSPECIKRNSDFHNQKKITCECCNKELRLTNKNHHNKTKKHIANLTAAENKKNLLLKLSKSN